LDDAKGLSTEAKDIIDHNSAEMPMEVLREVVYVLGGCISVPKPNVAEQLENLIR
jgi:hypothetical protein